jgi:hypothetical protein
MSGFDAMPNLRMHWSRHTEFSRPRHGCAPARVMLAVSHQPLTPRETVKGSDLGL